MTLAREFRAFYPLTPGKVKDLGLDRALRYLTIMNGPTDTCPTEARGEYCSHCVTVRALRAHIADLRGDHGPATEG